MKGKVRFLFFKKNLSCHGVLIIVGMYVWVALLGIMFYVTEVASIEIPPAVEKKSVSLNKSHENAERFFAAECGKCNKTPDPVKADPLKRNCTNSFPEEELVKVQNYVANVRTGKSLYESSCGRCHSLIDPASHTLDYWSKNLCTSDECFVKKLNREEEQQLLLYLSSHSKRD